MNDRVCESEKKILVIEDDPLNQKTIAAQLKKLGYCCRCMDNGIDALKLIRENPLDLILMDCNLPDLSGLDLTNIIRKLEENTGEHIPIIGITANCMDAEIEKSIEQGMDECLSKPVNLTNLSRVISHFLNENKSETNIDYHMKADQSNQTCTYSAIKINRLKELFNESEDNDFIREIVGDYLVQSDEKIKELDNYKKYRDKERLRKIIHNFKSTSGYIGATRLQELLNKLDLSLKIYDMDEENIAKSLREVKKEFELVKKELEDFLINNS